MVSSKVPSMPRNESWVSAVAPSRDSEKAFTPGLAHRRQTLVGEQRRDRRRQRDRQPDRGAVGDQLLQVVALERVAAGQDDDGPGGAVGGEVVEQGLALLGGELPGVRPGEGVSAAVPAGELAGPGDLPDQHVRALARRRGGACGPRPCGPRGGRCLGAESPSGYYTASFRSRPPPSPSKVHSGSAIRSLQFRNHVRPQNRLTGLPLRDRLRRNGETTPSEIRPTRHRVRSSAQALSASFIPAQPHEAASVRSK